VVPIGTRNHFFIVQDGIRMSLVRAVYQVMLVMLSREDVSEFWRRHPIILFKGPLPPRDFFWLLWKGFMGVQPAYFWSVLTDLEAYLGERLVDTERFFRLLNHGAQGGPPLDPGWVLQTMSRPTAKEADGTNGMDGLDGTEKTEEQARSDPREWLLSGLDRLLSQLFPGCRMERISTGTGSRDGALFLFHPIPAGDALIPDFRLFPGLLINGLPKLFGWSPFAPVEVFADMRSPGRLLGDMGSGEWSWKGDILRHRKVTIGRLMRFRDLIDGQKEAQAIGHAIGGAINRFVVVAERDIPHPARDCLVLREGCAYGSPFTLARVKYASSRRWDGLARRLRGKTPPLPGPAIIWESTEILHQEVLAFVDPAQNASPSQCL
jgi:hypothetical protein